MKAAGWRIFLLSMCAVTASIAIFDVFSQYGAPDLPTTVGQWGDTVAASSRPYHLVVLSTDPGRAADLAGLRPGDLIDIRANPASERFWLFGQPPTGRPVTVFVRRGAQQRTLTILTQAIIRLRLYLLTPIWLGYIWIALFAAIIAWRKSGDPQMRMLCLLLLSYEFWETTNQHFITSNSALVLAGAAAINALGALTVTFWAACAGSFAPSRLRLRRAIQWLCYALAGISIAAGLIKVYGIVTLHVDPIAFGSTVSALPFALACLAASVCTILALAATQGAERQRAIWSLFPGAVLIVVGFGAESLQGVVKSYELAWGAYYTATVFNILTPFVLTYVALNRRLLDIGFVLNRAAVFAIVSTTLIAAFVIIEWVANEWLSANHTTSAFIGMAVALGLGLSMRYVHRFADRIVDRVFFRKRHEDEARLRRFAHEAGFLTDRETLIERALSTVTMSTQAEASFLILDAKHASVDENDPALVALRAWRKPVDLELFPGSTLQGQFAFPMVARGVLTGVLICGTKQDSEVYAPDEFEALQLLADGVANALGLLSETPTGAEGALTQAIRDLRAAIGDLRAIRP